MKEFIRLSKILSLRGICSRREAEYFIEKGWIAVNGRVIYEQGTKVDPDALIELLPEAERIQNAKVTILLNKPVGIVSTQPEKGYTAAIELIKPKNCIKKTSGSFAFLRKLSPVGRLDIESKGLMVFTQDGVLAKKIIGENAGIEKEYLVYVKGILDKESVIKKLSYGLSLDGKKLKRAEIKIVKYNLLRFVLKEGKKRQIRRMCEAVGLEVTGLKRIRIGKILLGDLPEGKWRFLEKNESFF